MAPDFSNQCRHLCVIFVAGIEFLPFYVTMIPGFLYTCYQMEGHTKMKKRILSVALSLLLVPLSGAVSLAEEPDDYARFLGAIDMAFALEVATELADNPGYYSSAMGSRNAGSDAEHVAAGYIAGIMEQIGLVEVEKAPITVDKWSNHGASLRLDGEMTTLTVHPYASGATAPEGMDAEIVYAGKGTMADYEDLDPTGKIVLVDIDQRADWWITYPTLEAELRGAAGILLANTGGFSEISGDALNMNDFCGPVSIPAVSISQNDAVALKERLAKGPVFATLTVNNVVEEGPATSYNVIGRIKGKSSDQQIVIGSHYDTHYQGFQDNSCAVAFDLAIAKAMIDSGYTPERDIVFVSHGAEEWGAIGTVFDWSVGAYRMLTQAHPEWIGKTLAFINSELPAYAFSDTTRSDTAPELYTFIQNYLKSGVAPSADTAFPGGIVADGYQTYTYSDDFSYYSLGIPSIINGFLLDDDHVGVWDFYYKYYHTNFDAKDTYNEDVLRFNVGYYGAMAMYIDKTPALDLDFTRQHARLAASVDEDTGRAAGAPVDGFLAALDAYGQAAESVYAAQTALNSVYAATSDPEEKTILWDRAKDANALALSIFGDTQDAFLALMYERPIVRHEAPQENIQLMEECVSLLEAGELQTALDEYVWQVNNINEWYAYWFSPEVTAQFTQMMFGAQNQDNLFWGTGRHVPYANVEAVTRSLNAKAGTENPSFDTEIAQYRQEIEAARTQYCVDMAAETAALTALTPRLLELAALLAGD